MQDSLAKAKTFIDNGATFAACGCGKTDIVEYSAGIAPLVRLWNEGGLSGYYAADKIVGRAAALLYVGMRVSGVYAAVLSAGALEAFNAHGIPIQYGELAEKIINRKRDGICPMEQAVCGIDEPQAAFAAVCAKLESLKAERLKNTEK